jgi:hypothetical protein
MLKVRMKKLKHRIILVCLANLLHFSTFLFQANGLRLNENFLTITPTEEFTRANTFPVNLVCESIDQGLGPTWEGITIGESSLEDLLAFTEHQTPHFVDGMVFFPEVEHENTTYSIRACVRNNVVTALSILELYGSRVFLSDRIADFGVPDAVAYGDQPQDRVVFWFEKGIAAIVYVNTASEAYGSSGTIIYFPYQSVEGYETRWPYNRTLPEALPYNDWTEIPPIRNPFDFEGTVAAMTAQPRPTSTPPS